MAWFIGEKSAEGNAAFVVELNPEEEKAVRKFIKAQSTGIDEGYSGYFWLGEKGYNTEEEAMKEMLDLGLYV